MEENRESRFERLKKRKGFELLSAFLKSAAVGLLFAVICFAYDVYHDSEQDKQLKDTVEKLEHIEQSLSTRYLGIFPEYITEIDKLFNNLDSTASIVIFEDVLYYGIKSRPKEFCEMNKKLIGHSLAKGSLTVGYYSVQKEDGKPAALDIFHKMIIESRINTKYQAELNKAREESRRMIIDTLRSRDNMLLDRVDSTLCELYFSKSRDADFGKFKKDVDAYLSDSLLVYGKARDNDKVSLIVERMCIEIDSVKRLYLGKPYEEILFADYEMMYRRMSDVVIKYYTQCGVSMLPLHEYLTMSCWMVQKGGEKKEVKTVLAFPSKYSTDEIGFYSEDEAFSKYIRTMLEGVKNSQ